jgi:metal-responsive CopG/Arc/MetJ family transcriptional regulator
MHYIMDTQLTVRLPADLSEALAHASRKSGRKASEIVRVALRDYLNAHGSKGLRAGERAKYLIGSLESGISDLAERHREYIIESLTRAK